jgi:hypothetical protein
MQVATAPELDWGFTAGGSLAEPGSRISALGAILLRYGFQESGD